MKVIVLVRLGQVKEYLQVTAIRAANSQPRAARDWRPPFSIHHLSAVPGRTSQVVCATLRPSSAASRRLVRLKRFVGRADPSSHLLVDGSVRCGYLLDLRRLKWTGYYFPSGSVQAYDPVGSFFGKESPEGNQEGVISIRLN